MNRTELVASLTQQVSNNVEKIAISDSKIEAYYVASDDQPLIRVSDFDKVPGKVYARIDGLCGDKPISYVKEVVSKASSERMDEHSDFFNALYNEIFGR